jgi:hypothetical protein
VLDVVVAMESNVVNHFKKINKSILKPLFLVGKSQICTKALVASHVRFLLPMPFLSNGWEPVVVDPKPTTEKRGPPPKNKDPPPDAGLILQHLDLSDRFDMMS